MNAPATRQSGSHEVDTCLYYGTAFDIPGDRTGLHAPHNVLHVTRIWATRAQLRLEVDTHYLKIPVLPGHHMNRALGSVHNQTPFTRIATQIEVLARQEGINEDQKPRRKSIQFESLPLSFLEGLHLQVLYGIVRPFVPAGKPHLKLSPGHILPLQGVSEP